MSLLREDVKQDGHKANVNVIYTLTSSLHKDIQCYNKIYKNKFKKHSRLFCSHPAGHPPFTKHSVLQSNILSSSMITKQTWMLFTLIFVYFIVALNIFVKGGCSAGWLQNKRESYLHLFVSLNNIHVCFVTILLDILSSQGHSVLQSNI
jgi:hypothetical protein